MKIVGLFLVFAAVLAIGLSDASAQDDFFVYANFNNANTNGVYQPGQGCGAYKIDDRTGNVYVTRSGYCDVYLVSIPEGCDCNTHLDNPDAPGPMAPRTLTLVETYNFSADCGWWTSHQAAWYVDADYIYYGPDLNGIGGIEKWEKDSDGKFGDYLGKEEYSPGNPIPPPPENGETFGYDAPNQTWYTCARGDQGPNYARNVYSFKVGVDVVWQLEFAYPSYGGGHHDGLEHVGGFLWLSDMTVNFIGQWEYTGTGVYNGWDEVTRFSYSNPLDDDVEGMGWGPCEHFWVTGWDRLYEIGGGELQLALERIPDQCVHAGQPFATFDLDDYVVGQPPFTWSWTGNVVLTVTMDAQNVVTVAYPPGWIGSETITFTVTDNLGRTASDDATFTVDPVPVVGDIPDQWAPFDPFDLDNYLTGINPSLVTWTASGMICLLVDINPTTHVATVTNPGNVCTDQETITFTATAIACGDTVHDEDEATFTPSSQVLIPNTDSCVNPGEYVCLPILLRNNTTPFGGFELEVEFDYTSMTFVGAEPGELVEGFEKFTYRLLPCPACGCCKYKILLYGQYDIPNGVENIGDPIPLSLSGEYRELVRLCFVVNNDENLRGLKIPVCWEWEGEVVNDTLVEDWECGENTFSSWSGDTLFTSMLLCQFNPDICDDPTDRIQPILIFQDGVCGQNCGGVDVCPAGPGLCKRGDINMNDMTHEVADAVLFASYFVQGTVVFRYDEAYQICATDVNADGRTLTLSDLVYLIRVILHDAVEIPKLGPSSEIANVIVYDGIISTECAAPIGAILFEFDSAVSPTLLADMEMVHKGNKVLVWSREGKSFSTAEVLSADAELVSVTAVDRDSRELTTTITAKVAPSTFALHRAYPNPFNPFTNLSFNLPEAMNYSLKIYNVAGRLVRSYSGVGSQNLNVVTWDGMDNAGVEVSSGVYFYKLTAGSFSATEKMVMMK